MNTRPWNLSSLLASSAVAKISSLVCVLLGLVLFALFVPNYLDGTEFMAAEYGNVKVADVVAMDANAASLFALALRLESIFAIGTGFFLLHTGLFVPFHKRGVPQLMLAFVLAIAVYSHTQFITRSGHPWLQGADVSSHSIDFLITVRIVHGLAGVVLLSLAVASFLAPKPAKSKSA